MTDAAAKEEYFIACPRCGQVDNGFSFSMLAYINYTGAWGVIDSQECSDYTVLKVPKTVVCNECGCRVPMDRAFPRRRTDR